MSVIAFLVTLVVAFTARWLFSSAALYAVNMLLAISLDCPMMTFGEAMAVAAVILLLKKIF